MPELPFPAAVRVALFLLTMFVTTMGVFLCVRTDLVLTPTDGTVKTISEVFHVVFSRVKNGFDITLVAVSALLCLVNHAPFYGIGVGTVLSALLLGRIIRLYEGRLPDRTSPPRARHAGAMLCFRTGRCRLR